MNDGKGNGNFIEKIRKIKRTKKVLSICLPLLGLAFMLGLVLTVTVVLFERILPVFTTSSMVGVQTIYDETNLVESLNGMVENWEDEEKFAFTETKRQSEIWSSYYKIYGLGGKPDKEIDLVRITLPMQYQGAVNLYAFEGNFPNEENEDGTMANDYENEALVFNRDTRDFYKQAGERLGSTFLLYPNTRMMFGNLIGAEITYDYIKYDNGQISGHTNLGAILSDWAIVSKMYSETEEGALSPYHSPKSAEHNFDSALSTGFSKCNNQKLQLELELDDWSIKNSCRDYDLIFKDNGFLKPKKGAGELEALLDKEFDGIADIPPYYIDAKGVVYNYLKHGEYYYSVHVKRSYSENLYDEFMKEVYIPTLFSDYDSNEVYFEMQQMEQVYRLYNDGQLINIGGNNSIGGGTYAIEGVEYNCSNGKLPNLATYPGHGGIDINGVSIGTPVYPLFEGTVYSISRDNTNCYPRLNELGGYTCRHCSGTGYGNLVIIKGKAADGQEYYAYYGHLNSINVEVGQKVDINTKIGGVGNTGCSTGAHLHLELRKTSNGTKVFANTIYNDSTIASVLCSRSKKEE